MIIFREKIYAHVRAHDIKAAVAKGKAIVNKVRPKKKDVKIVGDFIKFGRKKTKGKILRESVEGVNKVGNTVIGSVQNPVKAGLDLTSKIVGDPLAASTIAIPAPGTLELVWPKARQVTQKIPGYNKLQPAVDKVKDSVVRGAKIDRINLAPQLKSFSVLSKSNVYVMIGIPGAGKSTWIKKNLPPETPIVSRDIIRGELGYSKGADDKVVCKPWQEEKVSEIERERAKSYIAKGKDFVIDDTNLGKQALAFIRSLKGSSVNLVGVKISTPLEECKKRREGQIPGEVLDKLYARLQNIDLTIFDKVIENKGI